MLFRRSLLVFAAALAAGCASTTASSSTTTDTGGSSDTAADSGSSADSGAAADTGTATADTGAPADAIGGNVGNPSAGGVVAAANGCAGCHGADYAGQLGSNITPSAVGIKDWTVADLTKAVREGMNKTRALCASMSKYTKLTDQEMLDLHAFLMSQKAVEAANQGSLCK